MSSGKEDVERVIRECDLQRQVIRDVREVVVKALMDLDKQLVEDRRRSLEALIKAGESE